MRKSAAARTVLEGLVDDPEDGEDARKNPEGFEAGRAPHRRAGGRSD